MTSPVPDPAPRLVRALGPYMAVAIVVGTVIGSGVFKKPQAVAEQITPFALIALVWVLGGVLSLLGALSLSEVAVLYPRAGGNYVFLREGYGRLGGFLWGWVDFWIIRSATLAALATIFAESLHDILRNPDLQAAAGLDLGPRPLGPVALRALTIAVILALALVNARGVRWGGSVQLFITLVKVGSLVAIFVLPFAVLLAGSSGPDPAPAAPERLQPVWPEGPVSLGRLGTAFLGVLWAYHGWMNIAPVAEEVRRPQRNLPLALVGGVGIIVALYLGANLAYALVLPRDEMAGLKHTTVVAAFGQRLLGPTGAVLASAAVLASVFGALNGNLLVGPRLLYAMAEDRLAPRALAQVHPTYHTPAVATFVLAAWAALLVLAVAVLTHVQILDPDKSHFDVLTDLAMFGAVIFETMAVLSIFVFRIRRPEADRPYRCPGYPVTPLLYAVLPALILTNMCLYQRPEVVMGTGFVALGALTYAVIFRRRATP